MKIKQNNKLTSKMKTNLGDKSQKSSQNPISSAGFLRNHSKIENGIRDVMILKISFLYDVVIKIYEPIPMIIEVTSLSIKRRTFLEEEPDFNTMQTQWTGTLDRHKHGQSKHGQSKHGKSKHGQSSMANLNILNLSMVNLSMANLSMVNLSIVNLSMANLAWLT